MNTEMSPGNQYHAAYPLGQEAVEGLSDYRIASILGYGVEDILYKFQIIEELFVALLQIQKEMLPHRPHTIHPHYKLLQLYRMWLLFSNR
jgi:hypothetical protein